MKATKALISPKKAIELNLIIGGANCIGRLQLFQTQLFKISHSAVRFDYFKLKYRSLQSCSINLKVVGCGAIFKIDS